jgi:hypothetical protein
MIARYRRRARLATELELGWFKPLHDLVPEIAERFVRPKRIRVEVTKSECPVIAQQPLGNDSGGDEADKEEASVSAGFEVVGHEGLASG